MWIVGHGSDVDLIVKHVRRGVGRATDRTDDLPFLDLIAGVDGNSIEVGIESSDADRMLHPHIESELFVIADLGDLAGGRRENLGARSRMEPDPAKRLSVAAMSVKTRTVRNGNRSAYGPDVRGDLEQMLLLGRIQVFDDLIGDVDGLFQLFVIEDGKIKAAPQNTFYSVLLALLAGLLALLDHSTEVLDFALHHLLGDAAASGQIVRPTAQSRMDACNRVRINTDALVQGDDLVGKSAALNMELAVSQTHIVELNGFGASVDDGDQRCDEKDENDAGRTKEGVVGDVQIEDVAFSMRNDHDRDAFSPFPVDLVSQLVPPTQPVSALFRARIGLVEVAAQIRIGVCRFAFSLFCHGPLQERPEVAGILLFVEESGKPSEIQLQFWMPGPGSLHRIAASAESSMSPAKWTVHLVGPG